MIIRTPVRIDIAISIEAGDFYVVHRIEIVDLYRFDQFIKANRSLITIHRRALQCLLKIRIVAYHTGNIDHSAENIINFFLTSIELRYRTSAKFTSYVAFITLGSKQHYQSDGKNNACQSPNKKMGRYLIGPFCM